MRADEREYLEEYKTALEEAWRGFWLTLGLWGLPAGFLLSGVTPLHFGTDRLAIGLAGAILFALVGAVVFYSPQGPRGRRLSLSDLGLPGRIEEDLLRDEVHEHEATVDAKQVKGGGKNAGTERRRYFVRLGGRQVELTGLRWMNVTPGQPLALAQAPASGMVLEVSGLRERLPMPGLRKPKPRRDPLDEASEESPTDFEPRGF